MHLRVLTCSPVLHDSLTNITEPTYTFQTCRVGKPKELRICICVNQQIWSRPQLNSFINIQMYYITNIYHKLKRKQMETYPAHRISNLSSSIKRTVGLEWPLLFVTSEKCMFWVRAFLSHLHNLLSSDGCLINIIKMLTLLIFERSLCFQK